MNLKRALDEKKFLTPSLLILLLLLSGSPAPAAASPLVSQLEQQYLTEFEQGEKSQLEGDFQAAASAFSSSLKLAKRIGNPEKTCDSLLKLGLMYWNLAELNNSRKFYNDALTLAKKSNLTRRLHLSQTPHHRQAL